MTVIYARLVIVYMLTYLSFIERPWCLANRYPTYLVVVDELLQFISVDNNMQATHLGKTELLPIYTSKTHLTEQRKKQKTAVKISQSSEFVF